MDTAEILQVLDREISTLQQARNLLANEKKLLRPITAIHATKRTVSPEARKRMADAQKRRWAKRKAA